MNGRLHELVTQLLVHHKHDPMSEAPTWARVLYNRMGVIILNQERIMLDTTQLTAVVARLQATDTAALALLQHVKDQNNDLAQQLASMPKSDDAANQAVIDGIVKQLSDTADTVDAAVAVNPQTPNLQPSPSEAPTPAPAPTEAPAASADQPPASNG